VDVCQYMQNATQHTTDQSRTYITDFTEYNIRPGKCASSSFVYYIYNYFNTQTFMYWTQDWYSSSKLWKWI